MEKPDMFRTLQRLAPNDHVVLFYSSIDAKRELVFPFLQEAIEKQGIAVYAAEHESLDELREAMKHWGIYVDRCERDHSLILTDQVDFMEAEERLNSIRSNHLLSDLIGRLMKRGGPIRIVADSSLLAKRESIDELLEKERALGRHLLLPMTVVCCYEDTLADIRGGEFLVEILRAHSHAVFPGIALQLA